MAVEYEVGYRKPPKHTQFRKGESGNAKGRPPGTKNLRTDLEEELAEKVIVREGGRTQTVSKQRALVKALVAGTIRGSARSTGPLLNLMGRLLKIDEDQIPGENDLTNDEKEVIAALEERIFGNKRAAPATDATHSIERREPNED